jgi:hypothetical protein
MRIGATVIFGALLSAGCGSAAPTACGARVPGAVAKLVSAGSAAGEVQSQSAGDVTCLFKATSPHGGAPEAMSVRVQSGPRAIVGFDTQIAHLTQFPVAGQIPQQVNGVGTEADWLPGVRKLLARSTARFVTVAVLAHGNGAPSDLQAASQVAQAALR